MRRKWRSVGFGALNLLAVLLVFFGVQAVIRGRIPSKIGMALLVVVLVACYLAGARWIERRQPSELVARAGLGEFLFGVSLGFALFTTVMMVLWAVGCYRPSGWGGLQGLASGFFLSLLAAVLEEILFRGFLFRLISKVLGTWGALAITSGLFGMGHAFNKGATVWSSIAIALEAGILLGAAYAATQRLWLPIGLHLGWNFTEGSIFGMSVSGSSSKGSLLTGSLHGPNPLTGGAFGPEASIVAVIVCWIAALFFLWRMVRLHRVESPIWVADSAPADVAVAG